MRISEAAARSGLSIDTIRFYEREGLVPFIDRDRAGRRRFSPNDLDWLILLASLRETGMPHAAMQAFADLYRQGDSTVADRKAALLAHAGTLNARRDALDGCAALLAKKLSRYDEILGEAA